MFEKLLTARLRTVVTNVYPLVAPMNYKTPCAVYQRLDTEAIEDLSGDISEEFVTFQVAISSTDYSEALTIAQAVRQSIVEWQDDSIDVMSFVNETMGVDNSTETALYRALLFFRILYSP